MGAPDWDLKRMLNSKRAGYKSVRDSPPFYGYQTRYLNTSHMALDANCRASCRLPPATLDAFLNKGLTSVKISMAAITKTISM